MVSLGGNDREMSILSDTQGQRYELSGYRLKGLLISDPHNFRSPKDFMEGAKGYLIFEIPKTEKPDKLIFVYYVKKSLEEKAAYKCQLSINLEVGDK